MCVCFWRARVEINYTSPTMESLVMLVLAPVWIWTFRTYLDPYIARWLAHILGTLLDLSDYRTLVPSLVHAVSVGTFLLLLVLWMHHLKK